MQHPAWPHPLPVKGIAMNHIVRRVPKDSNIEQGDRQLPAQSYRTRDMVVASQLSLGVEPRLSLAWKVEPWCWESGFSLLVFRSRTNFSSDKHPDDLNQHGLLFIETNHDAVHEEVPEEGTHFFTFVLHKKMFLGLGEKMSVLRFSETVPSAKVALGRIRDQSELQDMLQRHEVGKIEHEARLNEAKLRRIRSRRSLEDAENPAPRKTQSSTEALIAEEMETIDAMVEAMFAKRRKISDLKKDERFQKLSRKERDAVLERIAERLDAAEISARRETRGS
ncbi:MAG: hypothetical protein ABSH08_16960 [Tepidisphaeraceae bacterium]|jgi:hypothetical protein